MQFASPADIPYQLLSNLEETSALQGLSEIPEDQNQQLVTAYTTTLYYSALSNLYIQSTLPDTKADLDEQPRLAIVLTRTYTDFTAAAAWLAANKSLIALSSAKQLYDETQALADGVVASADIFYARD